MYPYILCFCGRSLGDLYDLFKEMRKAKYIALYDEFALKVDFSLLAISEDVNIELGDVLDALHITMDCCRSRMLTQVEFKDM